MGPKKTLKNYVGTWNMIKKVMLIVTEGETDEEFYKKLLEHIRTKMHLNKFPFDKINFVCARGIGNMQQKIVNVIERRLFSLEDMIDAEKTVILCYDYDVFEHGQHPPIDRQKLEDDIKKLGDCKIIKIVANRMIEDFFLHDFENIRKFLRLKKNYQLKGTGYEGLRKMFKDANRTYFKGERVSGFIDKLDMELIVSKISSDIKEMCEILGYNM